MVECFMCTCQTAALSCKKLVSGCRHAASSDTRAQGICWVPASALMLHSSQHLHK